MPVRKRYRAQSSYKTRKIAKASWFDFIKKANPKKGLIRKDYAPSLIKSIIKGALGMFAIKKYGKKTGGGKRILRLMFKLAVVIFALGVAGLAGAFVYFSKDIPDPNKIADRSVAQSTKIYDRTGKHLLYEIHGEEKRTIVKLDQISKHLINATIATEDRSFYKHRGIDFRGIARAIWKDVSDRNSLQGGSTITQQLIKNSILTSERTITRKIKEVILAIETEQKFSKDQIMEMYINQIPYGANAYGAEAAAQTFFGKSAKDLDVPESALLAALPKATTYYSPYGAHPEALEARYKYIIDQMESEEYISQEEAEKAREEKILARVKPLSSNIIAPHFVMYIRQRLVDEFGEEKIEKGGLKVYTTLFYEMQMIAEDAVKKGMEGSVEKYNARNAALVAVDPKTGQILSMVGNKDYFDVQEDGNVNVAISDRQPGSSFKPFVYATAFKKGYTSQTMLFDVETNFGKDGSGKYFIPHNYNLKFSGPATMKEALARSLNIPAVKTLYLAGIEDSIQTAHDMGITTLNSNVYGLALVLGAGEVKLLDLVSAYGVFASDGIRNDTTGILKIEDSEGNIISESKANPKQVLDTEIARTITGILSDDDARAPVFGRRSMLYLKDRPVAAKTGTTSNYKDGWTVGYTPSLVSGVWVGNAKGKENMNYAGGIKAAAPIWNDFMTRVLGLDPVESFVPPKPVESKKAVLSGKFENEKMVKIDKACGDKLAGELTPENQIEEKVYKEVHNILYYVKKDDPQGDNPINPQDDPMFMSWEEPVLAWAKENLPEANMEPPIEICQLRSGDNLPVIKIISPQDNEALKDGKAVIKAEAFANRELAQIDFYFDDILIGVGKKSPYEISYKLPGDIQEGIHYIRVKAYDNIGNSSEEKVAVLVSGNSSLYLKPIVGQGFPFVLNAVALQEKIKSVSFYYQLDSVYNADMELIKKLGPRVEIGKAEFPVPREKNLYQILWEEDEEYFISGKYNVFAIARDENGNLFESNVRVVEVK